MSFRILLKLVFLCICYSCNCYSQNSESKYFKNTSLEFNTIVATYNVKLSTEFEYYKDRYVDLCLQPGIEYINSLGVDKTFFSYSPYYDVNLLCTADLFYNSDFSLKPFLGIAYRLNSNSIERKNSLELKYGTTLQINISTNFNIILKSMYVSKQYSEDIPVLFGLGFTIVFNK